MDKVGGGGLLLVGILIAIVGSSYSGTSGVAAGPRWVGLIIIVGVVVIIVGVVKIFSGGGSSDDF